ncbi:MAG TPA: SAM-dependent methyltransferase [Actinomycetota bacterium]|nr:SAM-dependent methyltransferase [Actinomycetota bacterium]
MSATLPERLGEEIRRDGPVTFARFMEVALYDPADGFYARPPVGAEGHFLTSPHVAPVFAWLLARQIGEAFDLLGSPERFDVVEHGAGDGTLARQLTEALGAVPALARALRYVAVERSSGALDALPSAGIGAVEPAAAPRETEGVCFANELLDNVPFHLLRRDGSALRELFVTATDEEFAFEEGPPSNARLAELAASLADGAIGAVSPRSVDWLLDAASRMRRGYLLVIDYGGAGPRPPQTYRAHRAATELLRDPGSADITAGVDVEALAAAAREAGLRVWGPVSQRDALMRLGYGEYAGAERRRTAAEREAGSPLAAARRWARRGRESMLADPGALGSLFWLVIGVGVDEPLACVRD